MADAQPRKYAEGTEVSAEKSRAELEALLRRHGATEFGIYTGTEQTMFLYRIHGRMVRHKVLVPPLPKLTSVRRVHGRALQDVAQRAQDAEWRRRWRALVLVVKAKLEIIASGGSTFEGEFLADILLADNQTVGEAIMPRIAEVYSTGSMDGFLLGPGGSK